MEEYFSTYRKFIYKDDALELIDVLKEHQINYILNDNSSRLDSSFGNDDNTKQFELKIHHNDFEKVEKLEEDLVKNAVDNVEKDYYLFDLSDDELIEIVLKKDEWNKFDYLLAQNILKERGKEVNTDVINIINRQRIKDLSTQEASPTWLIIIGYISAALGGFLGVFIGAYLLYYKKTLPNGEKMYCFTQKDRSHGQNILILSAILFFVWIGIKYFG